MQQFHKIELINWDWFGILHAAQRSYSRIFPEIIFHISVSTSSFCIHCYFVRPFDLFLFVSTVVERLVKFYTFYIFLINGMKKNLQFFLFILMINLSVTYVIINLSFWKFSKWHIFKFEIYYYWLYLQQQRSEICSFD